MADQLNDCIVLDSQHFCQRLAKLPCQEKTHRPIFYSLVLSSLVAAYTTYFVAYNRGKKNVTKLVPGKVWKLVYDQFLSQHPGSKFVEETLKERLWETLKELKTGTSNEERSDRIVLQAEDVLTRLRNTDSHATRNILRLCQNMLEQALSGGGNSPTTFSEPSSPGMAPSQVQNANPRPQKPTRGVGTRSPSPLSNQKLPSKAELLAAQSKSMKSIARSMEVKTEGKEALLSLKMDIEMEKKSN